MVDRFEDIIKTILYPSEKLSVALEAVTFPGPEASKASPNQQDFLEVKCIVAVVSRLYASEKDEQACLFIFKPGSPPNDLLLDLVIPIVGNFSIVVEPSRHRDSAQDLPQSGASPRFNALRWLDRRHSSSTNDLTRSSSNSSSRPNSAPYITSSASTVSLNSGKFSDITITIRSHDQTVKPMTLVVSDRQQLASLLEECRRLKDIADTKVASTMIPGSNYTWILPYTFPGSFFWFTPSDLRTAHLPLHERLSPASGAASVDRAHDTRLIKEEWILKNARKVSNPTDVSSTLRIRIGTFNVNGQTPSQDLTTWVRGEEIKEDEPAPAPPVKRSNRFVRKRTDLRIEIEPIQADGDTNESYEHVELLTPEVKQASRNEPAPVIPQPTLTNPESKDNSIGLLQNDREQMPDILVFGFQAVDTSTEALLYSTKNTREEAWTSSIFAALGTKSDMYHKLASKQLVGMLIIVFVQKKIKNCFSEVKSCCLGVGMMGLMGDKGATAIRFTYSPSLASKKPSVPYTLTFVNSHLASDELAERRNADFHDLSRRLTFQYSSGSDVRGSVNGYPISASVFHSDALFWMGDLNYRVDLPSNDIRSLLLWPGEQEKNISEILRFDQLIEAMRQNNAFGGFIEQTISFPPTYSLSEVVKDRLEYDMKHKPAWTDRILHMSTMFTPVQQLSYKAHPEIILSDHQPVSAEYAIKVNLMKLKDFETAAKNLSMTVEKIEQQTQATRIKIEPKSIDFGKIRYKYKLFKTFVIRNTGKEPCAFRFVPSQSGEIIHPPWLRIEPMTGLLLSFGVATVNVMVDVDKKAASSLNPFHQRLNFMLHTDISKEHSVSVSAEYEPTCFANSLSNLIRLPLPIRSIRSENQLLDEEAATPPKEIMRLIGWLMGNGVNMSILFKHSSDPVLVDIIRECLDTGDEFSFPEDTDSEQIAIAIAETLLQLLDSLTDSLIPPSLHQQFAEVTRRDDAYKLLNNAPLAHLNVWISITAFLHSVSEYGELEAQLDRDKELASRFGSVMLKENIISPLAKRDILLFFIL